MGREQPTVVPKLNWIQTPWALNSFDPRSKKLFNGNNKNLGCCSKISKAKTHCTPKGTLTVFKSLLTGISVNKTEDIWSIMQNRNQRIKRNQTFKQLGVSPQSPCTRNAMQRGTLQGWYGHVWSYRRGQSCVHLQSPFCRQEVMEGAGCRMWIMEVRVINISGTACNSALILMVPCDICTEGSWTGISIQIYIFGKKKRSLDSSTESNAASSPPPILPLCSIISCIINDCHAYSFMPAHWQILKCSVHWTRRTEIRNGEESKREGRGKRKP